jgi:hypothetical protein
MSLEMAHKVILPPKKNYIPQFLKQRDINSYSITVQINPFQHRVHTEWRLPISGVHPIMMEKSALAGEGGGGCTPTPFQPINITYKVAVYAPEAGVLVRKLSQLTPLS